MEQGGRNSATERIGTVSIWTSLLLLLLALFLLNLALGSVRIPLSSIFAILFGGEAEKETWRTIVLLYRLPRALTAILAGCALSVSGLQMQTLFRNPLAGPYVLGISSGASLGVAVAVLVSGSIGGSSLLAGLGIAGAFGTVMFAGLGAGVVFGLIILVSRKVESNMTLLILGLMFGYASGSVVSILLHFSEAGRIQAFVAWTFGSFGGVSWAQLKVMAPMILLGLLLAIMMTKSLNAMLLGENYALSMGVSVRRVRWLIILSASLLAGAATAFCGPIAFVGIAVPHLCRMAFRSLDHRLLVPSVIVVGASLALAADLVAQMPGSQTVLPLNAVTAIIGTPVVVWVIFRGSNVRGGSV